MADQKTSVDALFTAGVENAALLKSLLYNMRVGGFLSQEGYDKIYQDAFDQLMGLADKTGHKSFTEAARHLMEDKIKFQGR